MKYADLALRASQRGALRRAHGEGTGACHFGSVDNGRNLYRMLRHIGGGLSVGYAGVVPIVLTILAAKEMHAVIGKNESKKVIFVKCLFALNASKPHSGYPSVYRLLAIFY